MASPQPPSPLTAPRISASVVPSSPPLKPKSSILNIFKRRRKAPYVPALSPAIGSSTSLALYDGLVTDSAMRKTTETTPLENNITSTSSYSGMGSEISFTLLGSLESSSNGDDLDPISGPSPLSPSERVLNSDPAPTTPSTPIIVSRSTQTLAQTFISKSTSSPPSIPSTTSSPPPTISPSVSPVLAPTQPAIQTLPSITVPTQTSPAVSNPVSAIVPPTPEPTYQPSAPSYAPLAAIDHKFRLLLSIVGILQYTKLLGCHGITEYIVLATVLFAAWIIMDLVYLFGMWRLLRNQHSKLAAASDVQSEGENTGIPQRKRRDRLAFVIYLQFLLLVVALPVVLYYDLKPNTGSTRSTPSTNDESGHDNDEAPQQQSIIRASFQWPMHAIYVVVVDLPFLQWGLSWYDNLSLIDAISGILSGYKGFFEKMWPFSMGWAIFALLLISPGIKKESMKDIIIFVVSPTFIWILSVILLPFNITFIWLLGWSVLICWSIAWLCIIGVILYYIIRILWRPGTWLVIWGIRFLGWLFEGLKDGIYTQERKDVPGILKISTFLFWVLVLVHWGITFKREKTAKEDWTEYLP